MGVRLGCVSDTGGSGVDSPVEAPRARALTM